jgi:predicted PurR-regulated permease PerM
MFRVSSNYFFLAILSGAIILAVLIFLPFLAPLVLAVALAVIFAPMHRKILALFFKGRDKSSLGAFVSLVAISVVIFLPLSLIAIKVTEEIRDMYVFLLSGAGTQSPLLGSLQELFGTFDFVEMLRSMAQWALTNINSIFTRISKAAIELLLMLLALFYLLRDGRELKRQLMAISPLGDVDDAYVFNKLQQTIRSIFGGSIAVGLIQGFLTGIGFAIFGVPNPVLWGLVAAIAALIPGIGTALVILPAVGYLFFVDSTGAAIGLLVWGALAVGLIDNLLGPVLIHRGVKIHPFLILLSVLGGLVFFGPIGFVLGPLVIALVFALLEIYRNQTGKVPAA